jgi:hypothetical protein
MSWSVCDLAECTVIVSIFLGIADLRYRNNNRSYTDIIQCADIYELLICVSPCRRKFVFIRQPVSMALENFCFGRLNCNAGLFTGNISSLVNFQIKYLLHYLINLNHVSDPKSIQLWRYEDPHLGPRKMPALNNPTEGAVRIEDNAVFCVDVEKSKVEISVNGTRNLIGSQIIYIVQ